MSKLITFSNHKGGVGKTTSTINVGAALVKIGKRVLLIDLDPQANLTQSLRITAENDIYKAIRGNTPLQPVTVFPGLDAVPSTLDLSGAEIELSAEIGRERILSDMLIPFAKKYDYILIDCPPSLGLLTINAFTASDYVIIPLQAQYLAVNGVFKLVEVIEKVQKRLNPKLKLAGIFITQYDHRKVLNREIVTITQGHFTDKVLKTIIRDNVAIAEAPTAGQDIFRYNPKSYGAEDYETLAKELLSITM